MSVLTLPPAKATVYRGRTKYVILAHTLQRVDNLMFHRSRQEVFFFVLPTQYLAKSAGLPLRKSLRSKCIPVLIYGLECFLLPKSDLKSLDFAVTRFL